MTSYTIINTQPTVFNDPTVGVVNGVLVRYKMDAYDEVHEVRVNKLDVKLVKEAIEEQVAQRDALANLTGKSK